MAQEAKVTSITAKIQTTCLFRTARQNGPYKGRPIHAADQRQVLLVWYEF